jgi:hypothetical protein
MTWQRELWDRLEASTPGGYFARGEAASEPTALAGLALAAAGRREAAQAAGDWLVSQQSEAGTVGVTATRPTPCWPTALAILHWRRLDDQRRFGPAIDRAVAWSLAERGRTHERRPHAGHDTTLVGWSWAAETHSWLEPTAMFVLALKAVGQSQHPRTREAVRLMIDRLLPEGGCNYGNTIVLGQELLPHLEPTGLVLTALADEPTADPRLERSLAYLERELTADTPTASLAYGLLGLAAHNRTPSEQAIWLEAAYRRTVQQGASPFKSALIALAISESDPFGGPIGLSQRRGDAETRSAS